MRYRQMGSLDWKVSALGFGCMRLPTKGILHRIDKPNAIKIIRSGIDQGINYIDTAWPYHLFQGEKVVGEALLEDYRERVHLTTKLPMFLVRKTSDFKKFLTSQLEKLQTDYIDTYLFHALNKKEFEKLKRLNLLNEMQQAQKEGVIKHIGFSFHDTFPVLKEIVDFYPWDVAQIQYNYMDTGLQATTRGLEYIHEKNIACVIMEPLKGGLLAHPPKDALDIFYSAPIKRTPVDWAFQYLWDRPEIAVVLSGMTTQSMVDENCKSADRSGIGSLTSVEYEILSQVTDIYRSRIIIPCTSCRYCMPCPIGVNIPQNFALLNNYAVSKPSNFYDRYSQWQVSRGYKRLATSQKELDKRPNNGQASICIDCRQCVKKCPQHINIPEELKKVNAILGRPWWRSSNITRYYTDYK